jgi:uncharacterized membrane protein
MGMAEGTIEVQASAAEAYDGWADFSRLPRYLRQVVRVEQLDDEHLLWVEEVDGRRQEWHAEVTAATRGERLSWQSTGPFPRHAGTVTFVEAGEGRTTVQLQLDEEPPGGPDDRGSAEPAAVQERVHDALRRFKHLIEGHAHARAEIGNTLGADTLQGEGLPGPGGGP